jgi:hypothetical protein
MTTQTQRTGLLREKLIHMDPSDFPGWVENSMETANRIRNVVTDEVSSGNLLPAQGADILARVFGELFGNAPRGGAGGGGD